MGRAKKREKGKLKRSQRAIWWPQDEDEVVGRVLQEGLYWHMFQEDFSLGIWPIGGEFHGSPVAASISPEDEALQRLLADALTESTRDHYGRGDLAKALYWFYSTFTRELLAFDRVTFEIVYLHDIETGHVEGFEFFHIPEWTLSRTSNRVLQIIPQRVAKERGAAPEIELDGASLMTIELAPDLSVIVRHLRTQLPRLDEGTHSFMESYLDNGGATPVDFREHDHAGMVALAHATKTIGWNARGLISQAMTDYYYFERQLRFERAKIRARESILAALNEALAKIGAFVGRSCRLEVKGLPTIGDVDCAAEHLRAGDMPLGELMKPLLL